VPSMANSPERVMDLKEFQRTGERK